MHCSVLDVKGATPLRKMDSSFLRSHQLPTVPELGTGAHGHPSHSMADFVQALCRQPQHSQWSCKQYLLKKKRCLKPSTVVHTCNLSTRKMEAGDSGIQSQPQVRSEFDASLDYMRLCLKKRLKRN